MEGTTRSSPAAPSCSGRLCLSHRCGLPLGLCWAASDSWKAARCRRGTLSSPLPVTRTLCHCGIWKRSLLPWLLPQDVSQWLSDGTRRPAGVGARPRGHSLRGIHEWEAALCGHLAHPRGSSDLGQDRHPLAPSEAHSPCQEQESWAELAWNIHSPARLAGSWKSLTFPLPASPLGGRNVRPEAGLSGPVAAPPCTWLGSSGDFLGPHPPST